MTMNRTTLSFFHIEARDCTPGDNYRGISILKYFRFLNAAPIGPLETEMTGEVGFTCKMPGACLALSRPVLAI
jgi:hypothetical protein